MTEVAKKARDWLGEIRALGGEEDEDKLRTLVISITAAAPELEERVCGAVSERGGDDEEVCWAWKHWAREFFEEAKAKREAEGKVVPLFWPTLQPRVEAGAGIKRRRLRSEAAEAGAATPTYRELKAAMAAGETQRAEGEAEPGPEPKAAINFHPSDLAKHAAVVTVEERARALEELADLYRTDPLAYVHQKREWAQRLCTTVKAIDDAVGVVREKRVDDSPQSQATKLVAIGLGEELWHSPKGDGYASVRVAGHRENYRIASRAFDQWIRSEYGRRNPVKVEGHLVGQAPGSAPMRDAIAQLEGFAKSQGEEREPAIRVGGDQKVIWIDLGAADWKAVRVTAGGWEVVSGPDVAFVRGGTMLALPEPTRGGDVRMLQGVLNLQPGDFVLAVGWLLQTLNPIGPYPLINVCGAAEQGKSTLSKMLLRTTDPNSAGLRRPSRKTEDILLAAKNGWTVG